MSALFHASSREEVDVMKFTATVCHDEAAHVWYVHSSDLPGLHAEASTLDELVEIIQDLAPDLVAANVTEAEADKLPEIPVCVQHLVNAKRTHAA